MTDNEKLEEITAVVMKALLSYEFENLAMYQEIAKRVSALIDAEILWQMDKDRQRELLNYWPKSITQ